MNTCIQTPDIDSTSRQRTHSSSSPDLLAEEEERSSLISSAGNSIDREADAVPLPIRTRLVNRINDVIRQDEDEGRAAQQLLATDVSRP
jgi:hypothetical protein